MACGRLLPRYALWLAIHEDGADPEALSRHQAVDFCTRGLPAFLRSHGGELAPRAARRLRREVGRFDPGRPTPYERFARLGTG